MLRLSPGRAAGAALVGLALLATAGIYAGDAATDQTSLAPLVTLPALTITFAAGWAAGLLFSLIAGFVFGGIGHEFRHALPNAAVLAASFALVVALFSVARTLYTRSAIFQAELGEAKAVHDGLFLEKQVVGSHWRSHVVHVPLHETGGDFYALEIGDDGQGAEIFIADVAGKGVRASMLLSALKTLWRTEGPKDPADKLRGLNRQWRTVCGDEMFCTAWYGRLNGDGTVHYANAGHERPFLRRADGRLEALGAGGIVLGAEAEPGYADAMVRLHPGDGLLLYTDGLAELMDRGELAVADLFRDFERARLRILAARRRDDVLAIRLDYVAA